MREARRSVADLLNDETTETAEQLVAKAATALSAIETGHLNGTQRINTMLQALSDELEAEAVAKPGTGVVSTGFASLDAVVGGFEPGTVHLYAARPSVGKSSLAVALARALAAAEVPVGVFWLEDTGRKFATRVAAAEAQIPGLVLRHGKRMQSEHWERLAQARERTATWPLYVEDTKGLTGPRLVARMRKMAREHGVRVFIADHLGEVRLDLDEGDGRRDEALGDVARGFRDTLDTLGAGGCLFHQLGRRAEDGGTPKLGWLFNSDVIGQVARVVGFLSTHHKTLEVYFAKCNYGPSGVKVELGWDAETMTVFEPRGEP
jgi:replicative DNA helicase